MSVVQGMRFASTFYDIEKIATSVPDEMLIRKEGPDTGRLFYKDQQGNLIDLFDKFASQIKADEVQNLLDDVLQRAKEYADEAVVDIGGGQSTTIARYVYLLRAAPGQKIFNIPLSTFDKDQDFMMFTTNTVMPDEGFTVTNSSIIFDEGLDEGTTVRVIIIKNIPVGPEGSIDARVLKAGTITEDLLDPTLLQKIYTMIEEASKTGNGSGGGTTPGDGDNPGGGTTPGDGDNPGGGTTPGENNDPAIVEQYNDSAISISRPTTNTTDTWIQLETANQQLEGTSGDMRLSQTRPIDPKVKIWLEPKV